MIRQFTAKYQKRGKWVIGWIEEISGVNTQGKTLEETRENLKDALGLVIESNRLVNQREMSKGKVIQERLRVSV